MLQVQRSALWIASFGLQGQKINRGEIQRTEVRG
jgi:hypothetical protein